MVLCGLGGVALVILAAVDAAYSGDWSRIEVISKQDELWLQSALKALAAWHVVNAIAAYVIADQNDIPKVPLIPKVMCAEALQLFNQMPFGHLPYQSTFDHL